MYEDKLCLIGYHNNNEGVNFRGIFFPGEKVSMVLQVSLPDEGITTRVARPSDHLNPHFPRFNRVRGHRYHSCNGLTFKPEGTELQIWRNSTESYLNSVTLPYELSSKRWNFGILKVEGMAGRLNLIVQHSQEIETSIETISYALDALDDEAASALLTQRVQERSQRFPNSQ